MPSTKEERAARRIERAKPGPGSSWDRWAAYRLLEELEEFKYRNPELDNARKISQYLNSIPSKNNYPPCSSQKLQNLLYPVGSPRLSSEFLAELYEKLGLDVIYILTGERKD